ncbi:MAG: DUF883 family protein [Notoacmeibacter sp.]|nr:DUF883 family protein [Notoacmeibacter sp.]
MATIVSQNHTHIPESNGSKSAMADVQSRLKRIKKDMVGLGDAIATAGAASAHDVSAAGKAKADELAVSAQETYDQLKVELARLERQLEGQVRSKPLQSLGIALGVGFLAALIMRR